MTVTGVPAAGAPASELPAPTDWAGATERVRDVTGWIVKAFVALTTVLIGSGPILVHLGNLHADRRAIIAIAGAAVALGAVGAIIWWASDINLTQITDITQLLEPSGASERLLTRLAASPEAKSLYLLDCESVAALMAARREEINSLVDQVDSEASQTDDAKIIELRGYEATSRANIAVINAAVQNLEGWCTYETIRQRFDRRRPRMFAAALLATIGVGVWLGALGADNSAKPAGAVAAVGAVPPGACRPNGSRAVERSPITAPAAHPMPRDGRGRGHRRDRQRPPRGGPSCHSRRWTPGR